MNLKQQVHDWLEDRQSDFMTGVRLYEQTGKSLPNLIRMFYLKKETDYNAAKLKSELKRLLQYLPGQISKQEDKPKINLKVDNPKTTLYRQRDKLHSELLLLPTDEDRYESIVKIFELQKRLQKGFKEPVLVKSQQDNYKRMTTLRTYISRYSKKAEQGNEKAAALLKKYQLELDTLDVEG